MTVFALKIAAMAAMLTDHAGHVLGSVMPMDYWLYILMRSLGRLAFPVFAFLIVNGLEKSSDRKRYLHRLSLFALVSQLPFSLVFALTPDSFGVGGGLSAGVNISGAYEYLLLAVVLAGLALFFGRKALAPCAALLMPFVSLEWGGAVLLNSYSNVFYTLALSLALIWLMDEAAKREGAEKLRLIAPALLWLAAALLIAPEADYDWQGILLIAALYAVRQSRPATVVAVALWSAWLYLPYGGVAGWAFFLGALVSAALIALYNGRPGPRVKLGFYIFYPAHLLCLYALARVIVGR